jgi:hypothetical protein
VFLRRYVNAETQGPSADADSPAARVKLNWLRFKAGSGRWQDELRRVRPQLVLAALDSVKRRHKDGVRRIAAEHFPSMMHVPQARTSW